MAGSATAVRSVLAIAVMVALTFFAAPSARAEATSPREDAQAVMRMHASIVRDARQACGYSILARIFRRDRTKACVAQAVDDAVAQASNRMLDDYVAALKPDQRYSIGDLGRRLHIADAALSLEAVAPGGKIVAVDARDVPIALSEPAPRELGVCRSPLRSRFSHDDARMGQRCDDRIFDQSTALDGFARMRYQVSIGD
jgi:hypothetical protein